MPVLTTVNKHNIDEGSARYESATRLLHDYLEGDGARVWVPKKRALLSLDAAYDDKLWMSRSGGRYLLTAKHWAPKCGHIDFKPVTRDRCPGIFLIAIAKEKTSFFCVSMFPA